MIDIKDIPDFVAETDPIFSYIHKVANHYWLSFDPEIQELTYSHAPHTFFRRYCNGYLFYTNEANLEFMKQPVSEIQRPENQHSTKLH